MLLTYIVRPDAVVAFGGEINNSLVVPNAFPAVKTGAAGDLFARWRISCQRIGQGMLAHSAKAAIDDFGHF